MTAILLIGLIVVAILSVIVGTPVKNLLPGYLKTEERIEMVDKILRVDSLAAEVQRRDAYIKNLASILTGEIKIDSIGPMRRMAVIMAPNREKQIVHTSSRELSLKNVSLYLERFFEKKSEFFLFRFINNYLCYSMGKSFAFIGMCKFNNLLPTGITCFHFL